MNIKNRGIHLMHSMLLSCQTATMLMEMKEARPLGFIKDKQLQMHVAICAGCRIYQKQTVLISRLLQKKFTEENQINNTDQLEADIIEKI